MYRLKFRLPPALSLAVVPGRHIPCLHGCVLTIDPDLSVEIEGASREQLFAQTRRFMRVTGRGHGAFLVAATLYTPVGHLHRADTWHIAVDCAVVIAATPIAPDIGQTAA